MEKNIIKEEIIELLEVILEQSEIISGYNKQIPQIEVDIVLSNIRELYEKYKTLEKFNNIENNVPTHLVEVKEKPETVKKPVITKTETEEKKIIKTVVSDSGDEAIKPVIISKAIPQTVLPLKEEAAEMKKGLFEEKPVVEVEQSQKKLKQKNHLLIFFQRIQPLQINLKMIKNR